MARIFALNNNKLTTKPTDTDVKKEYKKLKVISDRATNEDVKEIKKDKDGTLVESKNVKTMTQDEMIEESNRNEQIFKEAGLNLELSKIYGIDDLINNMKHYIE